MERTKQLLEAIHLVGVFGGVLKTPRGLENTAGYCKTPRGIAKPRGVLKTPRSFAKPRSVFKTPRSFEFHGVLEDSSVEFSKLILRQCVMILIPCTPSVNYPPGPFPCLGVKYKSNISFRKYYAQRSQKETSKAPYLCLQVSMVEYLMDCKSSTRLEL